ncbi:hypothetical protein FJTKL_13168 [Diaporthe vaccinii]|uniref:Citrate synthase n=1 Tax=Diaporthe vaccinii TaxID=105482 RepID=A0ABR4EBJ2_9PEZI
MLNVVRLIGAIDLAHREYARIGSPENAPALIAAVKAKKQRLFGYGHRMYKSGDPRSKRILGMIHANPRGGYREPP